MIRSTHIGLKTEVGQLRPCKCLRILGEWVWVTQPACGRGRCVRPHWQDTLGNLYRDASHIWASNLQETPSRRARARNPPPTPSMPKTLFPTPCSLSARRLSFLCNLSSLSCVLFSSGRIRMRKSTHICLKNEVGQLRPPCETARLRFALAGRPKQDTRT